MAVDPTGTAGTGARADELPARQIVFRAPDEVEVRATTTANRLDSGEVLLETSHVGVCGSDVAALTGRHPWFRPPLVTGHEVTARVRAVGTDVTAVSAGDPVLLNPLVGCGSCLRCSQGTPNQCGAAAVEGFKLPGAAATLLVRPATQVHRLPHDLDLATATLAEPLAAAWRAATRWDELDRVAVIGAGSIGQLVLAALRHRGADQIVVVEPVASKRELALVQGATEAVAPSSPSGSPSFTGVFDCVTSPDSVSWSVGETIGGGAVVSIGVPDTERMIPLPRMQRYEIALLGSGLYTPDDVDTAISLVGNGDIDVRRLISGVYPLDDAPAAYRHARDPDALKILIEMTTEP